MWWNVGPHLKKRLLRERDTVSHVKSGQGDLAPHTLKKFLEILTHKFGSVTRAWRVAMDTDESGTLTFREFSQALERVGYHGDFRSLWFQLDTDLSGHISLHEMDPTNAMKLEKFRTHCIQQFGSMEGAWKRVIDIDRSGTCGLYEFQEACKKMGYTDLSEAAVVFGLLNTAYGDTIVYNQVKFLQNWEEDKRKHVFRKRLPTRWVNKDPYLDIRVGAKDKSPDTRKTPSPLPVLTPVQEVELRKIFDMCDKGYQGEGQADDRISLSELVLAIKRSKRVADFLRVTPEEVSNESVREFFELIDTDEDRTMSWQEFKAFFHGQAKQRMKEEKKAHVTFRPEQLDVEAPRSQSARGPGTEASSSALSKFKQIGHAVKNASNAVQLATAPEPGSERANSKGSQSLLKTKAHTRSLNLRHGEEIDTIGLVPSEAHEDWSGPACLDHAEQWENFQKFLQRKFGTLSKAFDGMDHNSSGSLSMAEFVMEVCRFGVCRASDAKRLFLWAVPDGGSITWKEFGIEPQDWVEHLHSKRQAIIKKEAMWQEGARGDAAMLEHIRRTRHPVPKTALSFSLPLPRGWGFPPSFHPADGIVAQQRAKQEAKACFSQSARGYLA